MRLSNLSRCHLLFALAVFAACSSTDPSPPVSPDGGETAPDSPAPDPEAGGATDAGTSVDGNVDETCAEVARVDCDDFNECSPVYLGWLYGSYDACLARSSEVCRVQSSLAGSNRTADEMLRCTRAVAAQACNDTTSPAECASRPGALPKGGGCQADAQCASSFCRREVSDFCGVCADRVPDGGACTRSRHCESGRCSMAKCAPVLNEGDRCNTLDCSNEITCVEGICKKITRVGEGQACNFELTQCEFDMSCVDGRCIKDILVDPGQKCGVLDNGGFALCRGSACDFQLCVELPPVASACSSEGTCAGTAVCHLGLCKALTNDVCDAPPVAAAREILDEAESATHARHARMPLVLKR